ncbi:hypothetical protein [Burkholderia gladioli]|uniref:hypothetical protein n=1 Tax=Burkholderia gladioli TaxID=28095 RepID=UPI00163F7254|nr:hypothetical protein [Burkholderia gladioli]
MRIIEWIVDALLWVAVASDGRSADSVIAAQKRAARNMFLSLAAAAVFLAGAVGIAPDSAASAANALAPVTAAIQYRVAEGFIAAALVACVGGIGFFVRYVLVVKWPERFVNIDG